MTRASAARICRIPARICTAQYRHLRGVHFLHHEPYRKRRRTQDRDRRLLRAGANKFYNHGSSPRRTGWHRADARFLRGDPYQSGEHLVALLPLGLPSIPRAAAGCCGRGTMLPMWRSTRRWRTSGRQSVLTRAVDPRFEWGNLNSLLSSNGYAFDLVNDDTLQHRAEMNGQTLRLGAMAYRVLILPDITAAAGRNAAADCGVCAAGRACDCPGAGSQRRHGLNGHAEQDAEVKKLVGSFVGAPAVANDHAVHVCGQGQNGSMDTVSRPGPARIPQRRI